MFKILFKKWKAAAMKAQAGKIGIACDEKGVLKSFDDEGQKTVIGADKYSYVAILDQRGTAAPTLTPLVNDLNIAPVCSRNSAGDYEIDMLGVLDSDKYIFTLELTLNCIGFCDIDPQNYIDGVDTVMTLLSQNNSKLSADEIFHNSILKFHFYKK